MKYRVFINGGFANIPKEYEGELSLDEELKKAIFKAMKTKSEPSHEIRDGFVYHLKFEEEGKQYTAVFDEKNLPDKLHEFLDFIRTANQ